VLISKNLSDFTRGWVVGDFKPSLFQSKDVEIGLHYYREGEDHPAHYHREVTEYNVVISGVATVNGATFVASDIFIIEKGEVTEIEFLTDTYILCIKTPSVPGDKVLV